jgi:excisionase family DNA binding protein
MRTNAMQEEERVYSVEVAAELLSLSPWTIRKWIAEKKISSCKLGSRRVIPKSEVARLISESLAERELVSA